MSAEGGGRPYDQFILFGDSITEMSYGQERGFAFGAQMQDAYIRRLDVVNRGFAGYSSAHAIKMFADFFPAPETARVRLMTVFFGANDASVPGNKQHVPIEQYKANLQHIIEHPLTRAQNPHIIIITPPPIDEYQLEAFDISKNNTPLTRTAEYAKAYAEAARQVGASLGVPVADIWTAFMTSQGWKEGEPLPGSMSLARDDKFGSLFTDGLHLSPAGYRIVFDEVIKVIRANWPEQAPENLPTVFPAWDIAPK